MIRPNHELEVSVDATGSEKLFGTSSVGQGVLDEHETAREKREGISVGRSRTFVKIGQLLELNSTGKAC